VSAFDEMTARPSVPTYLPSLNSSIASKWIAAGLRAPRVTISMIFSATVGYARGICRGDGDGSYVINLAGDKVTLPEGATDAATKRERRVKPQG